MHMPDDWYPELLKTYTDEDGQSVYVSFRPLPPGRDFGPKELQDQETPIRNIGVWCSGGADSTSAIYLIARTIKELGVDVQVIPHTFRHYVKPWNAAVAQRVINELRKLPECEGAIGEHVFVDLGDTSQKELHNLAFKNFNLTKISAGEIDYFYGATTLNPPPEAGAVAISEDRAKDRDADQNTHSENNKNNVTPVMSLYKLVDKRFTAWVYKEFALENIIPLTRSCELTFDQTAYFQENCYSLGDVMRDSLPWFQKNYRDYHCWWCQERDWAFSRYGLDGRAWIPTEHMTQRGFVCPVFNCKPIHDNL